MLRAHLMATAIAHDDVTGKSNDYGLGRVSGCVAHWDHPNNDGWSNFWFSGLRQHGRRLSLSGHHVPAGTKRLVVVMTWDEPAASAGASRAVTWDLDLWVDTDRRLHRRPVRRVSRRCPRSTTSSTSSSTIRRPAPTA